MKADVLIMDEPTSSLTFTETDKLFDNLCEMKKDGATVIYISHRLEEVFEIADRISVLRDGRYVGTWERDKVEINDVVRPVVGREISRMLLYEKEISATSDGVALEVRNLSRVVFLKTSVLGFIKVRYWASMVCRERVEQSWRRPYLVLQELKREKFIYLAKR
ncbi:MAG: hypothetical protein M1371_08290 [Actinobacteria bacterium]|nr:hypothetical protein [Actinomycetota bacterium]